MTENKPTPAQNNAYWEALGLVFELGYLIAIPAFLFGFGGAHLDKIYGTSPLGVIAGLIIALLISSFAVYRRVQRITHL